MRRIGLLLALVVLFAAGWFVASWLNSPARAPAAVPRGVDPVARPELHGAMRDADAPLDDARQRAAAEVDVGEEVVAAEVEEPPGDGIGVLVIDPENAPIAGARVRLRDHAEVPECATDAAGRCRLDLPFEVRHGVVLEAQAEGFYPRIAYVLKDDVAEMRLFPATRLAGRVLERDTRAPISGAKVRIQWQWDDGESRAVLTDGQGWFEGLAAPGGSPFRLGASAAGFLEQGWSGSSLVVQPEERAPSTELLLERSLVGEFQVVDSASGAAVQGAIVSCRGAPYVADELGRVSIDRSLDPAETLYRLFVEAPGHCRTNFEVREIGDPSAPYVLRLPPDCRIVVLLRDAAGEPLSDVSVAVRLPESISDEVRRTGRLPQSPDSAPWPENARWEHDDSSFELAASDEGRVEFAGMPPGLAEIEVLIHTDDEDHAKRSIGPLGPPGSELFVDWQLEPAPNAVVRGRLLFNHEPQTGYVGWTQGDRRGGVEVGEDGAYSIDGLAAGDVALTGYVASAGARWGPRNVVNATVAAVAGAVVEQDLRLEIETGLIRGSIVDARGAPLAGRTISVRNSVHGSSFTTKSADDGTWSLTVADVPDLYRIQCPIAVREEGLAVAVGTAGIVLHELDKGRLRFRALDETTGVPLTSVMVVRRLPNGDTSVVAFPSRDAPDTTGWTAIELPEGEHVLAAFTLERDYNGLPQRVSIPPGGTRELEFRLAPRLALSVRLASELDAFPDSHRLLLLAEDEWDLVSAELVDGRPLVSYAALDFNPGRMRDVALQPGLTFEMRGLTPGRYRFKVFPDNVAIEPEVVDVPAEGVVEVRWESKP